MSVRRRARAGFDRDAGWRSHTFSDGTRSLTLAGELDGQAAERLRRRLRQLAELGCERLIVDVSGAVAPRRQAPGLLAGAFTDRATGCAVVVVLPQESRLGSLLPAWIRMTWSLSGARRLLAAGEARAVPVPDASG